MSESLLKWIRPDIRDLHAYQVPDASGLIKLDAMENPYRLDEADTRAWLDSLAEVAINRYPDPSASALKDAIKHHMQPPGDAAMVLGNGSDELIQMLAMCVAGEGRCLLSLEPGFVMYRMISEFVGLQYVGVPLTEQFEIDLDATLAAIKQHQPAVIFIAYPNNPSANCFDTSAIDVIIEAAPGLVVIDEAYHPFAQASYLEQMQEHEHLLVMRTVSKLGLAGLRLGVLFGHPSLIAEIDKVRLPYNINSLTQAAAIAILGKPEALEAQAAAIREQRTQLAAQLAAMPSIQAFHSDANFILFRLMQHDATTVFEQLREQGVLIKNMKASEGLLANCLRVTVGTPEENQAFIKALEAALV